MHYNCISSKTPHLHVLDSGQPDDTIKEIDLLM